MSSLSASSLITASRFNLSSRDVSYLRALTIVVAIGLAILGLMSGFDHYTPDSWSYVDIARNMTRQLGVVNGVRSFSNEPWLNDSFPFLWPAILSVPMELIGPTLPYGLILNLFFILPFTSAIILLHFFPKGFRFTWAGAITLLLCVIPGYMAEVLSGRSLPLSVLCLSAFVIVVRGRRTWLRGFSAALFLGLVSANRFDGFLVGLALAVAVSLVLKLNWLRTLSLSLGVLAGQVPWFLYSLNAIGKVFVSSSAARILNPTQIGPDSYPLRALHETAPNLLEAILEGLPRAALALTISLAPLAMLIAVSYLRRASGTNVSSSRALFTKRGHSPLWILGVIAAAVEFAQVVAAGFSDHRYFMLAVVLFTFAFVEDQLSLGARKPKSTHRALIALLAGSVLVITGEAVYKPYDKATTISSKAAKCIANVPQPFVVEGPKAYKIPAILGARVVSAPSNTSNLTESDWRVLAKKYSVKSWLKLDDDLDLPRSAAEVFPVYRCEN